MIAALIGGLCGLAGVNYAVPLIARRIRAKSDALKILSRRVLVLTYDDGPSPSLTPRILDLLARSQSKATFFCLGRAAQCGEPVLARAKAEGHEIGCHSLNHYHAWKTWPWTTPVDAAAGFKSLSQSLPPEPLFRPPYGKITLLTWMLVKMRGGRVAWWTLDSGDTHPVLPKPEEIVRKMVPAGGGVVLMHDFDRSEERAEFVLKTTELLLEAAKQEGIRCMTLSKFLSER